MTKLLWDQVGERRYETGIDHGVLYHPEGFAVPWNGLVSVTPSDTRDIKEYYLDGMKYLEREILGSYKANLKAYTYPDSLDRLIGEKDYASGISIHDQRSKLFSLSYRTRIANDVDDADHGYKIHIVYNVRAVPKDFTYETMGAKAAPAPFEWDLTAIPKGLADYQPVSHISLDSRYVNPANLAAVENALYGTDGSAPNLPTLAALLDLAT